MTTEPACPSCSVVYSEHLGLIGTCHQLQLARRRIDDLQEDLAKAKHERNVATRKLQKLRKET